MTEPTVQVPVSVIERAERFDRRGGLGSEVHEWLRELRALLSQPTPPAEPMTYQAGWNEGHTVGFDDGWGAGAAAARASGHDVNPGYDMPADPPRIEDMAPGTTFTARLDLMDGLTDRRVFMRVDGVDVVDDAGARWHPQDVDPSTIRDVTPPAVTS